MREPSQFLWSRLSPLFDHALDLGAGARRQLLADLRVDEPDLAHALEQLLAASDSVLASGFLESSPLESGRPASLAGTIVGGYTLVRPLGMGGMGTVWLADRSDGRFEGHVALKFVNLAVLDAVAQQRFRREGTLLARLSHPNIARLFDAGVTETGQPFLVLEYVEGRRIDEFADTQTLDVEARLQLFLQVADAVAHAHANLVVHRDLKPSNVLVDAHGQVKLLDFGIAALVDEGAAAPSTLTLAAGPALTPEHAAPEQASGGIITTATDVYALGVLLYQLLTGRHPTLPEGDVTAAGVLRALVEHEPRRASETVSALDPRVTAGRQILESRGTTRDRLRRACLGDLDTVAAKALKKDPRERYQSVTALADDVRRHLRDEPITARPDSLAYRSRKFVRRHRLAVAAAAAIVASLSLGLFLANRERQNAERRFTQVRALANRVLSLDNQIRLLPGSTKARHEIVAMAKDYLAGLGPDVQQNPDLAVEVAGAYFRLASVQGVPSSPNLGLADDAAASLDQADALLEFVIRRSPQRQAAQLLAVQVAEARMMLADNARLDDSALGHAQRAVSRLDALMAATTLTEAERLHASQVLMNVSLFYKNADRFAESVASGRRAMAMMPETSRSPGLRAQGLSIIADAMRLSGDLDGALRTIQEARRSLDVGSFDDASALQLRFSVLWREGIILGEDGRVSLGRTEEAIAVLQQAFDLIEDWSSRDVANAGSRVLFISAGRELGTLLWRTDPARALAVFDRAQQRLAEIKDNPRARRGMIDLLAGSSYALRALGRPQEAGQRLDAAAARLDELSANAASPGLLDAEKEVVMRARAEHFADTGQPRQAIELYQLLLNGVGGTAAPDASLTDACRFSQIYEALGRLHRAIDDEAAAAGFDRQRRDLWAGWSGRLSGNVFVVRQLALAEQGRRARYAS